MKEDNNLTAGKSTLEILGLVFIILKLCHVINWSWWWVLCPFLVRVAIFVSVFVLYFILALRKRLRKIKNMNSGGRQ